MISWRDSEDSDRVGGLVRIPDESVAVLREMDGVEAFKGTLARLPTEWILRELVSHDADCFTGDQTAVICNRIQFPFSFLMQPYDP